jgi:hypothetical protein
LFKNYKLYKKRAVEIVTKLSVMETKKHAESSPTKTDTNRQERIHKKAKSAATMESSIAAELKNREHGGEKPAR